MRKLEFRAWHDGNKEMVYFRNEKMKHDIYQQKHFIMLLADGKLEQYTGLLDKNRVKIFEGDIFKLKDVERPSGISTYKRDILTRVVYDTYSGFHLALIMDDDENLKNYFSSYKLYDVIKYKQYSGEMAGNIHKNPELIK